MGEEVGKFRLILKVDLTGFAVASDVAFERCFVPSKWMSEGAVGRIGEDCGTVGAAWWLS